MLEKQIEQKVCEYARSLGIIAYKFTSPARSAVPDRLFIAPKGVCFFVEFKRQGAQPTPAQLREHLRLTEQGCMVFIIDDIEKGKEIIDSIMIAVKGR